MKLCKRPEGLYVMSGILNMTARGDKKVRHKYKVLFHPKPFYTELQAKFRCYNFFCVHLRNCPALIINCIIFGHTAWEDRKKNGKRRYVYCFITVTKLISYLCKYSVRERTVYRHNAIE